jgi:hypothetical protein
MKSKYFAALILILFVLGSLSACGFPLKPAATPTNTPLPPPTATNTPKPTATHTLKPTATNTATITPDLKATQAAQNEQTVRDMLTEMEFDSETGQLAWFQEGTDTIALSGPSYDYKTFDDKFTAGDFVFYSDVTWKTDSWPTCGLMFRSDDKFDKGNFYLLQFLRFSGLPAWDIEYYKNGNWVTNITVDIKFTDFLKIDDGATNKIALSAIGNEFKLYVNGNYEGHFNDWSKKLSDGKIAFFGSQNAGSTKCIYENSWVWKYK